MKEKDEKLLNNVKLSFTKDLKDEIYIFCPLRLKKLFKTKTKADIKTASLLASIFLVLGSENKKK